MENRTNKQFNHSKQPIKMLLIAIAIFSMALAVGCTNTDENDVNARPDSSDNLNQSDMQYSGDDHIID